MMSKKDFDKIALIIYRLPIYVRSVAAVSALGVLESEPRFDRVKFLKVAGLFPCDKCSGYYLAKEILDAHKSANHDEGVENAG